MNKIIITSLVALLLMACEKTEKVYVVEGAILTKCESANSVITCENKEVEFIIKNMNISYDGEFSVYKSNDEYIFSQFPMYKDENNKPINGIIRLLNVNNGKPAVEYVVKNGKMEKLNLYSKEGVLVADTSEEMFKKYDENGNVIKELRFDKKSEYEE